MNHRRELVEKKRGRDFSSIFLKIDEKRRAWDSLELGPSVHYVFNFVSRPVQFDAKLFTKRTKRNVMVISIISSPINK